MTGQAEPRGGARILLQVEIEAGRPIPDSDETRPMGWVFPGRTLAVGRSKDDADLAIERDTALSRRHFEVSFDGTTCRLTDRHSTNGTLVNGRRMASAVLLDGDQIAAGTSVLSVHWVAADDAPDAAAASKPQPADQTPARSGSAPAAAKTVPLVPRVVLLKIHEHAAEARRAVSSQSLVWLRPGQQVRVGSAGFQVDWLITNDPGLAPLHFEVSFDGTTCAVQALDGGNGTLVNDQPVTYARLQHGDQITAGGTRFVVQFS